MLIVGLMSGTSLDGIDACLVDVHGAGERLRWQVRHAATLPWPPGLREAILLQLDPATSSVDTLTELDVRLATAFADAADGCAAAAGLALDDVDLIASHGLTLWHAPGGRWPGTLQLGRGAMIAARTGVTTVSDFRPADMALGGQGAPLVPYADRLLFGDRGRVALQNLGGIGNVTLLDGGEVRLAFDTGPGNMVIDQLVVRLTDGASAYDEDGRLGAAGKVDAELVAVWLAADTFLAAAPPKSTGREHYGAAFVDRLAADAAAKGVAGADLIATATAWTVATVADAYRRFLGDLAGLEVLVGGGGAANPTLMAMLADQLAPARVGTTADAGVPPDHKEALAFALLGHQTLQGVPNVLPAATGAREAWVLGSISPGRNFRRVILAPPAASAATSTESPNPASLALDTLPAADAVAIMHAQDWDAVRAVGEAKGSIAALVSATAASLRAGGRLFYLGAGTSGRLGVLDASEIPPTFSAAPELIQGLMAGGDHALRHAVEGAEDDAVQGAKDICARELRAGDVVVGISANGGAPYVRGALEAAKAAGCITGIVTCNPLKPEAFVPDHTILLPTGPELIAGSTRLKAGTATKLALNMLSTLAMVALGKVHDNLMVDVRISNQKLRVRAERLVARLTGLDGAASGALLDRAGGRVKVAVVMRAQAVEAARAEALLAESGGFLRPWLESRNPG